MPYSNISAALTDEQRETILTKLDEINALLPFLVNLSPDERHMLPKMGNKTEPFVEKALGYSQTNPNLVPPYIDAAELKKDFELVKQLTPVLTKMAQLHEKLDDTMLALGSEAFTAALAIYNTTKAASKSNIPGIKSIYDDLKARFPGRPKGSSEAASVTA
jgi:hypothetical protein